MLNLSRLACGVLLLLAHTASAAVMREDIGELKIHDLLLRPNFLVKEAKQGSFSIGESSFALRWELEQKFIGVIRIGPRTLLNPSARYVETVDDEVMLVEAFAQYEDAYGRYRFGRVPVEFGYEGKLWERQLIFPRSLLFQKRAMMLRDVGGSYEIRHNNFYTGFVIHNGESEDDTDGRTWYTARWGYETDKFEVGLAGQTGRTKPSSTKLSKDTLASVDVNKDADWRIGGLYAAIHKRKWEWVLEFYGGDRIQENDLRKFSAGHLDISYQWSKIFSSHVRYDHFDPDHQVTGDVSREISLGLVLSNKTRSSNLILVGTKVMEDSNQVANDELRLIWSLSPSGVVRF